MPLPWSGAVLEEGGDGGYGKQEEQMQRPGGLARWNPVGAGEGWGAGAGGGS